MCSLIAEASVRSCSHSGHRLALAVALLAQVPQALVVEVDVVLRLDELRGRFGVVDAVVMHRAPFSTCAMWMNFSGSPARSAQPCWCMTHDMSGETMYSAPARGWSFDLVVPHLGGDGLLEHREGAAEAAAFVGPLGRDELDPLHRGQQRARLVEGGLVDFRGLGLAQAAQASRSRCAGRPCAGIRPRETRAPASTSCRNSTSSWVLRRTACTSAVCSIAVMWSRTWWPQLPEGVTMWS